MDCSHPSLRPEFASLLYGETLVLLPCEFPLSDHVPSLSFLSAQESMRTEQLSRQRDLVVCMQETRRLEGTSALLARVRAEACAIAGTFGDGWLGPKRRDVVAVCTRKEDRW